MLCPNPQSPRMCYQWKYLIMTAKLHRLPQVLNIGSANDPLEFGDRAVHFDLDRWPGYQYFQQGDAHSLPYRDESFELVVMGDIIEHLYEPREAILEAARVCSTRLVMTIFEEWKLPGPGLHVEAGAKNGDAQSQVLGYEDREDYQDKVYPERVGIPDAEVPHLVHIWQFTDEIINTLVSDVPGFRTRELVKEYEVTHNGHPWYNWLVCLQREVPQ